MLLRYIQRVLRLTGITVAALTAVSALGVTILGPEPPDLIKCANTTAPCRVSGCTRSEGDRYKGTAACCKNHSGGRGCCQYGTVVAYWCLDAQGNRCYGCGSAPDLSGPCSDSGYPDASLLCDTDPCSQQRGHRKQE